MKAASKISFKRIFIASALGAIVLFAYNAVILAQPLNGFDLQGATIPEEEVFKGGPSKDGIPSIDKPSFIKAEEINELDDSDLVLGVSLNGVSKAYPLPIMNWHEIANDFFGDLPVVVTFCPLCGSGMAFESQMDGRHLTFGVSGLFNASALTKEGLSMEGIPSFGGPPLKTSSSGIVEPCKSKPLSG